jgi:transposase-like protein
MLAKKATTKGKRYSEDQKAEILKFVEEQGRGGASSAAKKYGISPITISSWKKSGAKATEVPNQTPTSDRNEVLRVLAKKGFKIARMMNVITGEILEEQIDPKIEKLALEFKTPKGKADESVTYVVQTAGQVMVSMTLERLLALTNTKP